jgi:hypothetical protein
MEDTLDEDFSNISDLFEDDVDDIEEEVAEQSTVPGVTIALPGSSARYVNIVPGMTVGQILNATEITLNALDQSIWVDGVPAGVDTQVQPGSTITAVGRAKGG